MQIELSNNEQRILEMTKKLTRKSDWVSFLELSKVEKIIKKLYDSGCYSSGAKRFLSNYYESLKTSKRSKVKTIDYPNQKRHISNVENFKDKTDYELNKFLEDRAYYSNQRSLMIDKDLFKAYNDRIKLSTKLKYLDKDLSYFDSMDLSIHSLDEFKLELKKEVKELYPNTYLYCQLLRERTLEALVLFSDEEIEELVNSFGLSNYLGFNESPFEKFFYNSGHFETTFMAKKIFESKFKSKPFLLMQQSGYESLIKLFIDGEITSRKKVLLVSSVISYSKYSDEEILKLKKNNYILYPLNKSQVETYGRIEYIKDLIMALNNSNSKNQVTSVQYEAVGYIKSLLTFNELLNLLKLEGSHNITKTLLLAGIYSEGMNEIDGELDFSNVFYLEELDNSY